MNRAYRIAYIVGLQHCGSALLGRILNAHNSAISVGELVALRDYADAPVQVKGEASYQAACVCGAESLSRCDFWNAIDKEVERRSGLTLRELDLQSSDPLRFADHNRLFFDCLADITGTKLIIDTSKKLNRLHALLTCTDLPLLPIHLLRDPKGQIHALLKRGQASILGPAAQYRKTTLETLRLLRDVKHLRLRYENLVTNPEAARKSIMQGLGLTYQSAQLSSAGAEGHGLPNGQPDRTSNSGASLNEDWHDKMGVSQRALITLLTLPATYATRRY